MQTKEITREELNGLECIAEGYKAKVAWNKMPKDMLNYIKSLPEYDDKVFRAITEAE